MALDLFWMWEISDSGRQSEQGRKLKIRARRNWKGSVWGACFSVLLPKLFINVAAAL